MVYNGKGVAFCASTFYDAESAKGRNESKEEVISSAVQWELCYRYVFIQIHILDGLQNFNALFHRSLEGLATRDESHATRAFIDDRSCYGFSKITLAGRSAT